MTAALTKTAIDAEITKIGKGQRVVLNDDREAGLFIRIRERGAKWGVQVRTRGGQKTRVTLGTWPALGIADAREAARDAKREASTGINPNEARREADRAAEIARRSRRGLADVLDDYEVAKPNNLRRGAATRRALDGKKGLLRDLLKREPRSITRADIADAVRRHAKTSPIAANRALAYANAFFNWCVGEELIETNPAGTVKKPSKENTRDRVHTLPELAEIWEAAGTLGYPFGPLYRLLMVLPMRREEIAAMPVAELELGRDEDPASGVWTLPAARTKRANALRVPLSPLARSIIMEAIADPDRPKDSAFVFTTTGETSVSGFTKGKRRLDKAIADERVKVAKAAAECADLPYEKAPDEMPHWTVHDLRTSFTTNASDRLGIDATVADRCLNHTASATTSKIMRVYNKSELFEPRKAALCAWASLIDAEVRGVPARNVVTLRPALAA